jgi:DNA-binding NtrC family response regulator
MVTVEGGVKRRPSVYGMNLTTSTINERDKRVLLVEDDPDTLALMRRLLARCSIEAVPASTCAAAWRAAEDMGGVDLVVTDEALPDGTGSQLALKLARRYGCEAIVVSGTPPAPSLPTGVGLWLTKPVDFTRLRDAVLALVA